MKKFFFIYKEILKGKSIARSYLNFSLLEVELKGDTIDIGGGSGSAYIDFVKKSDDVRFKTMDIKSGDNVDFETDSLPAPDGKYDTVLFLNVMEHIYNHQHIANEVYRIVAPGGRLVGYVPFLMWYHPDHKDFFRYTHEALEKIFAKAGANQVSIKPDYCGPFIAALQMMLLSMPLFIRAMVFPIFYALDLIFFLIKKKRKSRYVLGYLFVIKKSLNN